MGDVAIRCEGLGKRYRIGARQPYKALRDTVAEAMSAPFRRLASAFRSGDRQPADGGDTIWALRDVSFEVKPGEVVGIIGRNGAGKSTLLRILSRISEPTEGCAEIRGRVGSLLEVGTGFHPELTGRENIYLNGVILGMRKVEIDRKLDEIVAFAEVERFLDTPVKHYSSGMHVRLAFAVAAHLEPEILLVDEVLAVGDAAFQRKCLGTMGDVARSGRTVLFVSHNAAAVTQLCARATWFDEGRMVMDGPSNEVLSKYQARYLAARGEWRRRDSAGPDRAFAFLSVVVLDSEHRPSCVFRGDEPILVEIRYVVHQRLSTCQVGARVYNSGGIVAFTTSDADGSGVSALPKDPGAYRATLTIPGGMLSPDGYYLLVAAHAPNRVVYETIETSVAFQVSSAGSLTSLDGRLGIVAPLLGWDTTTETCTDTETCIDTAPPRTAVDRAVAEGSAPHDCRPAIRQVLGSDYEALASFFQENNRPDVTRYFHPFPLTSGTAHWIACGDHLDRYYVATVNGCIAGLCMLRGWDQGFEIPSFGVLVDYRHQGRHLGRRMTEFAIGEARRLGCDRIRLSVHAGNAQAVRLYGSLGFREIGREPVVAGGAPDTKIAMLKVLQ